MQVRHIMSRVMATVTFVDSLLEARRRMQEKHVKRALVVDLVGRLVGIIDRRAIRKLYIAHLLSRPGARRDSLVVEERGKDAEAVLARLTVKDAVVANPLTVDVDASVELAAMLMKKTHKYGLPVLEDGRLVGILNERAVFRALVRIVRALRREAPELLDRVLEGEEADT